MCCSRCKHPPADSTRPLIPGGTPLSTSSSSASEIGPPLPHFSSLASPLHATRPRQKVTWDRSRAALALLLAVVVGVAVDQAVTTDVVGTAGTLAGAVALVALAVTLRPRGTELVALSLAGTLVPWLTLRSSGWLIGPDVVAICALTMLAASGGTPPTTFLAAARRLWAIVPSGVVVPGELRRAVQAALPQGSPQRRLALLRGLAIAAPLGGLLLVLLASGDRLFATLLGAAGSVRRSTMRWWRSSRPSRGSPWSSTDFGRQPSNGHQRARAWASRRRQWCCR